jgi:stage V sporulation protein B
MQRDSTIKGALFLSISSFLFILSGYLTNIMLGRYLGPKDYGSYGIIISLISIINITQTAGLPQALSKFIAEDSNKSEAILKKTLTLQILSNLTIAVLFFLLAYPIASILNDNKLTIYLQISSLIFPFYGIYALYTGYYNGLQNFTKQSLINNIYYFSKTILVLVLGYYYHLIGAIVGFVIAPIFTFFARLHIPKKTEYKFNYKKLILFSLPLIGFAIFSSIEQSIDLLLVKMLLLNNNDPGYYTASQNIARIPYVGLSAFSIILLPSISRSVSNKNMHTRTKIIIEESFRYIMMLILPVTLLISAKSAEIIEILFSREYLPASESLSILIFGYAALGVYTALANILIGAGRPLVSLATSILCVILTTSLCFMLIPSLGLNGAAISTSIGSSFALITAGVLIYKGFTVLISTKSAINIIFSSIVIFAIAKLVAVPLIILPVFLTLLLILYLIILIFFKEIKEDDWSRVKRILPYKLVNQFSDSKRR